MHVEILGSMTSEATGEACLWDYVGTFLASDWLWIGFSIPTPGLECLARLVDFPELWITCVCELEFFFPCYLPLGVVIGLDGW